MRSTHLERQAVCPIITGHTAVQALLCEILKVAHISCAWPGAADGCTWWRAAAQHGAAQHGTACTLLHPPAGPSFKPASAPFMHSSRYWSCWFAKLRRAGIVPVCTRRASRAERATSSLKPHSNAALTSSWFLRAILNCLRGPRAQRLHALNEGFAPSRYDLHYFACLQMQWLAPKGLGDPSLYLALVALVLPRTPYARVKSAAIVWNIKKTWYARLHARQEVVPRSGQGRPFSDLHLEQK